MTAAVQLKVLLFRDGDAWISQCIDCDLNGQGSTIMDAVTSLFRVVVTHLSLAGATPGDMKSALSQLSPVPEKYKSMFDRSYELRASMELPSQVGGAELRLHA